ncbi:MAG: PQQ-like beta-propeller repeat protein [Spirochaetaceae bacterium]|jgi:outer membrane protein assembly factor BamB|nr:PQQ-like beta-propeller repeat protein [Spirochaetaceae bacterium]
MRKMKNLLPALLLWALPLRGLGAQTAGIALWKQPLDGQVIGLPSVQAGSVAVVCEGGNLSVYSRQGNALWTYNAGGKLSPFVTRSREGTIYICRTNGQLIAVNRIGRELWRRALASPLSGPVLIGWDGRLFAPTRSALSCYTIGGALLWHKAFASPIAVNPREDKRGGVIMALENAEVLRIDPFGRTGTTRLAEVPALLLSAAGSDGPEGGAEIPVLVFYKNGAAEIIGSGAAYPPLPKLASPPVGGASRNGNAAVTLGDGQVILIRAASAEILWAEKSGVTPVETGGRGKEAAMLYDERGIYMLSKAGAAGFNEDGERLWFLRVVGAASLPIFSDEGVLYSGGSDWNLYAYRLEDRILLSRTSLYGPAPEGSYGLGFPFPPRRDYANRFSRAELRNRFSAIDKALQDGDVGEREKEFTAYLMEAASSVRNNTRLSLTKPPVQAEQRIEAAGLLSRLGSKELIPFLADLFSHDPEPLVQAAAARAIGRIGVDPDGLALGAFSRAVIPSNRMKNEQLLLAVAASAGALCRFSGPPVSGAGAAVLIALAGQDKPARVRAQALQEISSLSGPAPPLPPGPLRGF